MSSNIPRPALIYVHDVELCVRYLNEICAQIAHNGGLPKDRLIDLWFYLHLDATRLVTFPAWRKTDYPAWIINTLQTIDIPVPDQRLFTMVPTHLAGLDVLLQRHHHRLWLIFTY